MLYGTSRWFVLWNTRSNKLRWLRPIPEDWIPWHLTLFIAMSVGGMALRAIEELPLHK